MQQGRGTPRPFSFVNILTIFTAYGKLTADEGVAGVFVRSKSTYWSLTWLAFICETHVSRFSDTWSLSIQEDIRVWLAVPGFLHRRISHAFEFYVLL